MDIDAVLYYADARNRMFMALIRERIKMSETEQQSK